MQQQAEIAEVYGYREFAEVQQELAQSIDHQAWLTGDGPKALFDAAVLWLRERKVLLAWATGRLSDAAALAAGMDVTGGAAGLHRLRRMYPAAEPSTSGD